MSQRMDCSVHVASGVISLGFGLYVAYQTATSAVCSRDVRGGPRTDV